VLSSTSCIQSRNNEENVNARMTLLVRAFSAKNDSWLSLFPADIKANTGDEVETYYYYEATNVSLNHHTLSSAPTRTYLITGQV